MKRTDVFKSNVGRRVENGRGEHRHTSCRNIRREHCHGEFEVKMSHARREKFLLVLTLSITNLSKPSRFNMQLILRMQKARCRSHAEAFSPTQPMNCGPSRTSRPIGSQRLVGLPMLQRASTCVSNRNTGVFPCATADVPIGRWSALLGVIDSPQPFC